MITAFSEAAPTTGDLDIKSILLVDDDGDLLTALKPIFEASNYLVTTAKNGVSALREIMALDFDVIICDLMMPTMPGDMFYLAVQKVKPHLCSRFLFVTGHSHDERVHRFLMSTDGLALYKPVPADTMLQMVSLVLARNKTKPFVS